MIVVLEQNIPCLIKAITVSKPKSFFNLRQKYCTLLNYNFFVWATICDNHVLNISIFSRILLEYRQATGSLFIEKVPRKIYLFYDLVHLINNIRSNLLNQKRFVFHHLILVDITTIFMPHERKFLGIFNMLFMIRRMS